MGRLTADFDDFIADLGPADENDKWNWSQVLVFSCTSAGLRHTHGVQHVQFNVDDEDDMDKYFAEQDLERAQRKSVTSIIVFPALRCC
jgi:hypothetical protein